MTFLEKMIMDYNNGLHTLPSLKKISILQQMFLQHGLKPWNPRKLIPYPLVTSKLIPKGTLGLLYTNIAQLMTHTTVVYVAAYLAIMLPSLLAYCRG